MSLNGREIQEGSINRPPGLSVVIVSWNAARYIAACLESCLRHPPDRPLEIIVIDNASTDGSLESVRRFGNRVRVLEMDSNLGFAGACNEGFRHANEAYILFLNSDIEARSSSLEALCRFMDSHPEAGAVSGKLLDPDGTPQIGFNVRSFPTVASVAFELLMVDKLLPNNAVSRKQRMLDFSHAEVAEVDQPAGACLLVSKRALDSVGLFDQSFYPAWFEDVDLCFRLVRSGFSIFFVPEAEFLHHGGVSLETLEYGDFLSHYYRNLLRFFDKHHGRVVTLWLKGMIVLGMLERLVAGWFVAPRSGVTRSMARTAYWRVMRETI